MRTFQDLLTNPVLNRKNTDVKVNTYGSDGLIRGYNNIWGIISDTHMSKLEDGRYIISGSMLRNRDRFNSFLYAWNWGGYTFNAASVGCRSLACYLNKFGYTGNYGTVDGDIVYILTDLDTEENLDGQYSVGTMGSAFVATYENKEIAKSLKCNNLKDVLESLNTNENIEGVNWSVASTGDSQVCFVNENNNIIKVNK